MASTYTAKFANIKYKKYFITLVEEKIETKKK